MKYIFSLLICIAGLGMGAADLMVENFAGPGKTNWIPSDNSSNKITMSRGIGKLSFDGKTPEAIKESGAWFTVQPKANIKLDAYRYMLFRARSTDGKSRAFTIYISRELSPGNTASFYTITELTPEWRDYNLKLERGDRVNFGKGIFALARVSPNGSTDLSAGGRLVDFTFAVGEPAQVEMAALRFGERAVSPEQTEIDAIVKGISQHKKFVPYAIPQTAGAKSFTLAENGKSDYSVAAGDDTVSQFAAVELAKYLHAATGAEFNGSKKIHLKIAEQEPADGFSLRVDGNGDIEITGNNGRGLVYGVYDFLERVAGCRFFGPFDYMEVVPKADKLTVPEFSLTDAPLMNYRFPHYCNDNRNPGALEHLYAMADYATKNRYNVELQKIDFPYGAEPATPRSQAVYGKRGGIVPLLKNWGHNLHVWLPPEQYFAEHPEYYCFERATGKWRAENAQLCTTNSEVADLLAGIARKQFQDRPEMIHFGIMQEDGHRLWCQCDKCLAVNPSRSNLNSATDNNLYLANAVAAKIGPEKRVLTYAYGNTASPPKAVKPLPNVDIQYCQYGGDDPSRMPWEESSAGEILQWAKLSGGNLNIYSYNYLTPFYTFSNAAAHTASFRYYNMLGIRGSIQEMGEVWSSVNPYHYYLSARLAWNPWFDEIAFRKDYFAKLYGPAGEPMEQLYILLDRELSNKKNQVSINPWYGYIGIPNDQLERGRELVSQAQKLAAGDRRIEAAIHAQAEGVKYLTAVSNALYAIRAYRLTPTPENRTTAISAVDALEKQSSAMILPRLGYLYHVDYLRQVIDEIKQSAADRAELERGYKIVMNLDRGWKFASDPDAAGEKLKYFSPDFDDASWADIRVGDCWENQGFPGYDGAGWYRLNLDIPPGDNLHLYFGAADERAWVYLDGKYIGGHHEGDIGRLWQEPFFIAVPQDAKPGAHQLTVKVIDSAGAGGLWKDVYLVAKK